VKPTPEGIGFCMKIGIVDTYRNFEDFAQSDQMAAVTDRDEGSLGLITKRDFQCPLYEHVDASQENG